MMRCFTAIVIGTPILLIVLFLMIGPEPDVFMGKGTFLTFLAFWVICTAGLVLIPFFLVALLVGRLVLSLFPGPKSESGTYDMITVLMNYIQSAKRKGVPKAQMEAVMARNGWSDADIAEARRRLGGRENIES